MTADLKICSWLSRQAKNRAGGMDEAIATGFSLFYLFTPTEGCDSKTPALWDESTCNTHHLHGAIPREWLGELAASLPAAPRQASWALLLLACFGSFCKRNGEEECGAVAGMLPATPHSPWGEEGTWESMSERLPQLKGSKTLLKVESYWSACHSIQRGRSTTCLEHTDVSTECEERSRHALHRGNFIGKK